MSIQEHWNAVFRGARDEELGWFESDVSPSLEFVDDMGLAEASVILLPGAGTSGLVDALLERGHHLVVNDISNEALERLQGRLGNRPGVSCLCQDISAPLPPILPPVDAWVDRAVLHFLLDNEALDGYFANLRRAVRPGGFAFFAEFAEHGATRCAGRDVRRYTASRLLEHLGPDFQLVRHEHRDYTSPTGGHRPYVYALFERSGTPDAR